MDTPDTRDDEGINPVPTRHDGASEAISGQSLGRYKLLQKIGEGGCGVVYLAEQEEPVRRRVALKVIKLGMDTKEVIARFETERQALALMDHPNIAKELDAGATASGRPFFVMEFVRGVPITQYCDENKLPTAARLELFAQVCHAVQHAHQKGVIHRDLKPTNILVTLHDGVPLPKVIDFGIAKATQGRLTDHSFFTALEQFVGTPAYMSPEQAEFGGTDIDTRSDVYSLGVLLYELLTGRTPFDPSVLMAAGIDEVRRHIREVAAPRPSARLGTLQADALTITAQRRQTAPTRLIGSIRGDLDWIALRCLEKDRSRRYATAAGIADDLQHFLRNEPVSARPPGTWYVLRKLAQRNRVATFGVLAVLAAITVGAILTVLATVDLVRAERVVAKRAVNAATATRNADATRALLRGEFTTWLTPGHEVAPDIRYRTLLDNMAMRIESQAENRPERSALLHGRLAEAYLDIEEYGPAQAHAERALEFERQLDAKSIGTAMALSRLVRVFGYSGKVRETQEIYEKLVESIRWIGAGEFDSINPGFQLSRHFQGKGMEAINESFSLHAFKTCRRVLGEKHPLTLEAMERLVDMYLSAGKLLEAEALLVRLVALQRGFWNFGKTLGLANALRDLVRVYRDLEKRPEEASTVAEVFEFGEKPGLYNENFYRLRDWERTKHLALLFHELGQTKMAEKILVRAAEQEWPDRGPNHPATLMVKIAVAFVRGRMDEAGKLEQQLFACNPYQVDASPLSAAISTGVTAASRLTSEVQYADAFGQVINLAEFYQHLGKSEKEAAVRAEIARFTASAPHLRPQSGDVTKSLAAAYLRIGNWVEAERLQTHLLELRKSETDPKISGTIDLLEYNAKYRLSSAMSGLAAAMSGLAAIYSAKGRADEAVNLQFEVVKVTNESDRIRPFDSPPTMTETTTLARYYSQQGNFAEAERLLTEWLGSYMPLRGSDHADTLKVMHELADLYGTHGKFAEAAKLLSELLRVQERVIGPRHSRTLATRRSLGSVRRHQGKFDEAVAIHRQVIAETMRVLGTKHPDTFEAFHALADDYVAQNKFADAADAYAEATRLAPGLPGAWNGLAWLRATAPIASVRDAAAAIAAARKACELTAWNNAKHIGTLAAAHAEAGQFVQAVEFQRKALDLATLNEAEHKEWEPRLALYLNHEPYHQPDRDVPSGAK